MVDLVWADLIEPMGEAVLKAFVISVSVYLTNDYHNKYLKEGSAKEMSSFNIA